MPKKDKKQIKKKETEDEEFELSEKKSASATPNVKVSVESSSKDLRELIEKNIKWSQVIYEQNKKIRKKLTWMTVWSYVRLAIIAVPIILGIIYLPPFLDKLLSQYSSALGITNINSSVLEGANLQNLIEELGISQ